MEKLDVLSTSALAQEMQRAGAPRGYLVWRNGEIQCSNPALEPFKAFLEQDKVDFDEHEGIFLEAIDDVLMGVFLWRTHRGQGCGGIRLRSYDTAKDMLVDGMRLAIGMGKKSAVAGLWKGGGKGLIACSDPSIGSDLAKRHELLHNYGRFITSLRGAYVAAEDSGITVKDMDEVFKTTRHTTCISESLGGSGNPSVPTAAGIVCGMEGALHALGMGTLEGKSVAVQGCGNVGGPMIKMLFEKGVAKVVACDLSEERVSQLQKDCDDFADKLTTHTDGKYPILEEDVDIVSPCAFGGVLHEKSVAGIKAKIICGAANNQLLDPADDYGLSSRGITYIPDFIVNRMGIVNCANEEAGRASGDPMQDPLISTHFSREDSKSIFQVVQRLVAEAKDSGKTTVALSDEWAVKAAAELNPIFGHRTQLIIDNLVKEGWEKESSRAA
mmetsp:Transcript_6660/g.11732  ORF Transcript_6660/g.11732 Transcript_6660/m.11732 type:complete len:441 (-) Transcript_6660:941-2263(-)